MIPPPIGPDLPGELWKPIPGYETLVEVSNKGRLRSTPRKVGTDVSESDNPSARSNRYLCANLPGPVCGYGNPRTRTAGHQAWKVPVHRIVALAFLGKPPRRLTQINHKDGDKLNNAVENLEYCTPAENIQHAYDTGLNKHWTGPRKLTPEKYDEIRDLYRRGGWTHDKLAVKYGVSATHIGYVLHRSKSTARRQRVVLNKARG